MRENWKYQPLGEICDFISGFTPSKQELNEKAGIPYFKVSDMNRDTNSVYMIETELFVVNPRKTIPANSIIFPKNGGAIFTGKKRILKYDSIIDLNTEALNIKDKNVNLQFLYTFLLGVDFGQFDNGGGLPSINIKKMKDFIVPVPPLPEQERIVALLDDQFAKIDTLKANAASQLQAAKDLFQSALKEMLTPKEGWEMKKVGDCFISINNGANIKQTKGAGGIPITRIETLSNGVFNVDRLGYANIDDTSRYSKYILKDGDLLMSHINSVEFVGRTVVYHDQLPIVIHGMNLLRLVPNTTAISDFYYYAFKAPWFRSQLEPIIHKSVNQASMNTTALKQVNIYIPNKEEQRKIVSRLDAISEKVKALQANYDQTINLCNDLKQSLLKSIFA